LPEGLAAAGERVLLIKEDGGEQLWEKRGKKIVNP